MKNIFHKNLSYRITGLCFEVHNELGRFCKEKQYADKLEELLKRDNISYQREFEIQKMVSTSPKGNKVDFLVENLVIVEMKAKPLINKEDYLQTQRYLESSGLELCLLVNFRHRYLKPKRVLNYALLQASA